MEVLQDLTIDDTFNVAGVRDINGQINNFADRFIDINQDFIDLLVGPVQSQLKRINNKIGIDRLNFSFSAFTEKSPKAFRKVLDLGEKYLNTYGYVSKSKTTETLAAIETLDQKALSAPIRRFQRLAGIPINGQLDAKTLKYMSMTRCGVEDTVGAFSMSSKGFSTRGGYEGKRRRRNRKRKGSKKDKDSPKSRTKRYDLIGSKWEKRSLTYGILSYTPDMSKSDVDKAIRKALNLWAKASSLKFSESKNPEDADIRISFGSQYHGDGYSFDGKGGTLAHAFFPQSGEAHFDEDELFSNKGQGTNLFIVAAHEFGHSLGLAHSTVPDSLMAPFYQGYVADYNLHPDDIAAIQQLYGKNVDEKVVRPDKARPTDLPKSVKPTKKPRENLPDICTTNLDAVMQYYNKKSSATYAFKGSYYYKLNDDGVVSGYPKKIGQRWKKVPGNLNAAAHSRRTGYTYFFKGKRVYSFEGTELRPGYPRTAESMGLPSHPTAVLAWGLDGMLYIFKKKTFVQFDDYTGRVSGSRHISTVWKGVPEGIGSTVTWSRNGKTYFFKGNKYWRFNDRYRTIESGYPQSINKNWLGCTNETDVSRLTDNDGKQSTRSGSRREHHVLARLEERPRDATKSA